MTALRKTAADLARAELRRRAALARIARLSLPDFARQAIAAGVVHGLTRVDWGRHLDAFCFSLQMQLEAWLVSYGKGTPEMVERQRAAWERTGAQWEDGEPEPWLRYVLVQNEVDNLPPGTLKSTLAMVIANAWIWLWDARFAFGALSGIDANVERDSKATRDLVRSQWYRETFQIAWQDCDLPDGEADAERRALAAEAEDLGVKRDSDAVSSWATTAGGRRISRTLSSGLTGTHVDCIFLDDPDDADKVWSEAERLKPQNRWTRAVENRINCELRSLRRVLQQRVHVADFSSYLIGVATWSPENPKGWAWLCIPAEYGLGPAEAPTETPWGWRDWRTERGELMDPRRISAGVLADKKLKLPGYDGQYNQNPRVLGAGMFAARHLRWFLLDSDPMPTARRPEGCTPRDEAPPITVKLADLDRLTLSVDAANSLAPNAAAKVSAVGLIVAGCRGEERFVLDDRTRVLGPSETYWAIYELMRAWPLERVLVEAKALGNGAIDEIQRAIRRGWYLGPDDEKVPLVGPDGKPTRAVVEAWNPGKDSKEQRAHGMLPPWQQGLILVRDGAGWLFPTVDTKSRKTVDEGFIGEVTNYPASRRSDRVDALGQLVAYRRGSKSAADRWRAMARV